MVPVFGGRAKVERFSVQLRSWTLHVGGLPGSLARLRATMSESQSVQLSSEVCARSIK